MATAFAIVVILAVMGLVYWLLAKIDAAKERKPTSRTEESGSVNSFTVSESKVNLSNEEHQEQALKPLADPTQDSETMNLRRPIIIAMPALLLVLLAFHIGSRVALSNRIQASIERAPYGGVSITTPTGTHEYRVSNKAKVSLSFFLDRLIIEDDRRLLVIPISEGITVL